MQRTKVSNILKISMKSRGIKMLRIISIIIMLSLFVSQKSPADDSCADEMLSLYLTYRKTLLSENFSIAAVEALQPMLRDQIKEGKFDEYVEALRIAESRVLTIKSYSASCRAGENSLYMKIKYESNKFDRRVITYRKIGSSYFFSGGAITNASPELDLLLKNEKIYKSQ